MASTWARSARFLYAFREREKILDLFEEACGARLTYSYLTVGGATARLPPRLAARSAKQFLDQLLPVIDEYHALLTTNAIFVRRTAGIGVMSAEMAIDYGCTGPVLRGSGVDQDLRRDGEERYTEMYDGYAFEVIVEKRRPLSARPQVSARARLGRARRLLAPVLRADAGSHAVDRPGAPGHRPLQHGHAARWGEPVKLDRKAAQGRGLSRNRSPARPDGLLYRQRRLARFPGVLARAAVASATCP